MLSFGVLGQRRTWSTVHAHALSHSTVADRSRTAVEMPRAPHGFVRLFTTQVQILLVVAHRWSYRPTCKQNLSVLLPGVLEGWAWLWLDPARSSKGLIDAGRCRGLVETPWEIMMSQNPPECESTVKGWPKINFPRWVMWWSLHIDDGTLELNLRIVVRLPMHVPYTQTVEYMVLRSICIQPFSYDCCISVSMSNKKNVFSVKRRHGTKGITHNFL